MVVSALLKEDLKVIDRQITVLDFNDLKLDGAAIEDLLHAHPWCWIDLDVSHNQFFEVIFVKLEELLNEI